MFALLGAAGLLGVNDGFSGLWGVGSLVIGAVVLALAVVSLLRMGSSMATSLQVDAESQIFGRKNGNSLRIAWTDPFLKVDLAHLEGKPDAILPSSDARVRRPYWVNAWTRNGRSMGLETTVPSAAIQALLDKAQASGARVTATRVAFFWQNAPKSPDWLSWEAEGKLRDGHTLNGQRWLIRGTSVPPDK